MGINTEIFIDLLTTNVNSYFRCCSPLMMIFSVSTVDCSDFIFFRAEQIILHSLAIDSTLDACVQNKRILQDNLCTFFLPKHIKVGKKINKSFTGFGWVHIVKNCDLGLENAAIRAEFSRPRSQFFTIRISQLTNNIYNCGNHAQLIFYMPRGNFFNDLKQAGKL